MCEHLAEYLRPRSGPVTPRSPGCEECLAGGGRWVHLRLCMSCGHVGCCDSSPGRHATAHFHATDHPVIKSYEPGEDWAWCYRDEDAADRIEAFPGETPAQHLRAPGGGRDASPR